MKKHVCLALAVLLVSAGFLKATTVQRLGLEDLARKAHHIVAGKVRNSKTFWSGNGKLILTSYTIDVADNIKGQPPQTLELTTIGGKIGDLELHVAGMPSFAKGEEIVVFTEQSAGYEVVLGATQGKFTVENGEVFNDVSDLSFPDGRPGKALKLPVQTFKNQIRTILSR